MKHSAPVFYWSYFYFCKHLYGEFQYTNLSIGWRWWKLFYHKRNNDECRRSSTSATKTCNRPPAESKRQMDLSRRNSPSTWADKKDSLLQCNCKARLIRRSLKIDCSTHWKKVMNRLLRWVIKYLTIPKTAPLLRVSEYIISCDRWLIVQSSTSTTTVSVIRGWRWGIYEHYYYCKILKLIV